jgi:hypothetical protein
VVTKCEFHTICMIRHARWYSLGSNTLHSCVLILLFTQPLYTHIKPHAKVIGFLTIPRIMQGETLISWALECLRLVFPQNWLICVTFLLVCVITSHNSINIPKGAQVIVLVALNWKF